MMKSNSKIGPGRRSNNLTRFKKIIWQEENNFVVFDIKSNRKLKENDGIIIPIKKEYNERMNQEETNSISNTSNDSSKDSSIDYFNHENQFQLQNQNLNININLNSNQNQNQHITEMNEFGIDYFNNNVGDINFDEEFNCIDSDFTIFNEKEYFNPSESNEADYPIFF